MTRSISSLLPSMSQDTPLKFVRVHSTSPREALTKVRGVIEMYMTLMAKSNGPVDWNCEQEYAEDYQESTTALPTPTAGSRRYKLIIMIISINIHSKR